MRPSRWLIALLFATSVAIAGCSSTDRPGTKIKDGGSSGCCGDDWVVNADIWGSPEGDLFVAGYRGNSTGFVKRFEGGAWTTIYEGGRSLKSIWGTSSNDFFVLDVASSPMLHHYLQGVWDISPVGPGAGGGTVTSWQARALWGTTNDDLFVAGDRGIVMHFDGVAWQAMNTPTTERLTALWGSAHDNIIAVGDYGTILRFDGDAWSIVPSPTVADLNAVWGASADQVFIVGEIESEKSHVILHFDGLAATVAHQGDKALLGVGGAGPDRVYAVGAKRNSSSVSGGVFRFDGNLWTEVSIGIPQFLWDVWVNPDGSYIVVGPDDTIVQRPGK